MDVLGKNYPGTLLLEVAELVDYYNHCNFRCCEKFISQLSNFLLVLVYDCQ